MTEFNSTLNKFREMGQSIDVLLDDIERIIKHDNVDPSVLLKELAHENIKKSLSRRDRNAIKQRIVAIARLLNDKEIDLVALDNTVELLQSDSTVELDNTAQVEGLESSQTEVLIENPRASSCIKEISPSPEIKDSTDVDAEFHSRTRIDRTEFEGRTLNDRYTLEKFLGSGGMGMVYRAVDHLRLKSDVSAPYVAIKILCRGVDRSQNWIQNLQIKGKRPQQFTHPHIVDLYEINCDKDIVYLVMEYLPGKTLREMIHASDFEGLPLEKALPLIRGMGEALAFAHNHGIVHYDFKPNNVIITNDGRIKVIDFGFARASKSEVQDDCSRTQSMALTPVYASPEMLERQPPDPRDDIYALGTTVYELLTGNHPFARKCATQARDTGLEPQQPDGLNEAQWESLKKSLSFDRHDRTLNVTDLLEGLDVDRRKEISNVSLLKGMVAATVLAIMATSSYLIVEDNGIRDQFESLVNTTMSRSQDSAQNRSQATVVNKLGDTQTDVRESEASRGWNRSMFASIEEQQIVEQSSHAAQESVAELAEFLNLSSETMKTHEWQDSQSREDTTIEPAEAPVSPPMSKRQAKSEAKSERPPRTDGQAWVVQVGSFRLRNNAIALRDKLKAAGYQVIEEKGETRNTPIYRIKVGPVERRERAAVLLAKLRREQKLDGYVARFP